MSNPTTGEWTVDRVKAIYLGGVGSLNDFCQRMSDAINAAIAAIEHKWNLARLTDIKELTDKHAQQLAEWTEGIEAETIRLSFGDGSMESFPAVVAPSIKQIVKRHNAALAAAEKSGRNIGPTTGENDTEREWPDDSPAAKAPHSPLVENYLRWFTESILHGDEVHKAWLLEAVECFIEGKHIPEPRAQTPIPTTPTTGEWTPERVGAIVGGIFNGAWAIADAQNAAIAAKTKVTLLERDEAYLELHQQLAAEREKAERWEYVSKEQLKIVQQLREQLAEIRKYCDKKMNIGGKVGYHRTCLLAKIGEQP